MSLCLASLLNRIKSPILNPIFRGVFFTFSSPPKKRKKSSPRKKIFSIYYIKYTTDEYEGDDAGVAY